jgi:hypothetical protein
LPLKRRGLSALCGREVPGRTGGPCPHDTVTSCAVGVPLLGDGYDAAQSIRPPTRHIIIFIASNMTCAGHIYKHRPVILFATECVVFLISLILFRNHCALRQCYF